MWTIISVSGSSCVLPIRRSSQMSVELHLTSPLTETNTVAPPKLCVNSLPATNMSKTTLFLFSL